MFQFFILLWKPEIRISWHDSIVFGEILQFDGFWLFDIIFNHNFQWRFVFNPQWSFDKNEKAKLRIIWKNILHDQSESIILLRGVINGKAGKTAALPKFSDTLTLSQSEEADYAHPPLKFFVIPSLLLIEVTCSFFLNIFMVPGEQAFSACCLLCWAKVYELMHSILDFCPRPARKKTNVLHKRSYLGVYVVSYPTRAKNLWWYLTSLSISIICKL